MRARLSVSALRGVPWLTVLIAGLGATFGVNDFIKNNDIIYVALLCLGQTPTVPATYWVFGGWKAGLLGAVFWLSLPYVLIAMLAIYLAATGRAVRNHVQALALFLGGAALFSGMWDAAFLALVLNYWPGSLMGDTVAWLPIALGENGEVIGISFSWGFGVWFIVTRIIIGLTTLLPIDASLGWRWKK